MIIEKIQLTEDKDVTLTTYIQTPSHEMKDVAVKPAILILPGGGYHFCSDREGEPIALSYLSKGYNAFVLQYSVKEKSTFPRPLMDAEIALNLIKKNAEEWHIDKDRIACIGFSAGGHLASQLATSKVVRPNAVIFGYGAFVKSVEHHWNYPTAIIDKDVPEAFIFHSENDEVVPVDTSLYMANEYRKVGVPFELHIFKEGLHGLSLADHTVTWGKGYEENLHFSKWFELSVSWLNDVFKVLK